MADERDPEVPQPVSRRYRELPGEEPSRELDQAILAAAHRAADKPHAPLVTPAGRHRWYFAFGAAAILVLAVAVTVQVERQQPDAETMAVPPVPAASDRVDDLRPAQQTPAAPAREAPAATERPRRDRERSAAPIEERKQNEAPAEPASSPAAKADAAVAPQASPAPPMPAKQPAQRQEQSAASGALSRDTTVTQAGAPAPAARAPQAFAVREPPERWLERIVQLRKEGRHEEADKQLAEFRRQYPDYKVPETASKRE